MDLIERQEAIDTLMKFERKLRKINWHQYPSARIGSHHCRCGQAIEWDIE